VLVSDLQQGSKLEALLAYEWPSARNGGQGDSLPGRYERILQLVTNRDSLAAPRTDTAGHPHHERARGDHRSLPIILGRCRRVRVKSGLDVYVAAGHSTVSMLRPAGQKAAAKLVLTGDDQDFDNVLYSCPRCAGR